MVEYTANSGKVTVNGVKQPPWDDRMMKDADGWYSSPTQVGGGGHPGTMPPSLLSVAVTSEGSPKIRLRWTGSGLPPAVAWLLVDSTASWGSTRGTGSANNGFGDPAVASPSGQSRRGKHVIRLTGGTQRIWSAAVSATATATSLASDTQSQTAGADILILGSLANKNASLARTDGGGFNAQTKDDVYVADTLLSWDNSEGWIPAPPIRV